MIQNHRLILVSYFVEKSYHAYQTLSAMSAPLVTT